MSDNNQGMSIAARLLIGIGLIFLIVVLLCGVSFSSAYNLGNKSEQALIATKDNNRNIYAEGTLTIQESAQVPGMYRDDYIAAIKADIEGRYGAGGSKATFQFLKEHNVTLDPALYTKIQQQIEIFRTKFEANQTRLIDEKRSYQTELGSFPTGIWLRIAGYPRINLADYQPITSDQTEKVFKDGKESGPMKLR